MGDAAVNYSQLLFQDQAREKLLKGATILADAVRGTLGPRPRCVLLGRKWGQPQVCDDGITIVKNLQLKDPEEQLGVQMLRQASERTSDAVGDGTTTAVLLAHTILREGLRNIVAGASAAGIKEGLDAALAIAVDAIRSLSEPVVSHEQKVQVATVSAHNNANVGQLVATAVERAGTDGIITVEEAKGTETVLESVEGLQFDHGFLSPYFINDRDHMQVVLEDPLILLSERRINVMSELVSLLEQVVKAGRPLLIIAEEVEGEALATLVVNHLRGVLPCAAVKAPGFGAQRQAQLQDIAVLTGAQLISDEIGVQLADVRQEMLGRADRALIDKDKTTLIGGGGDKADIAARCAELRRELESIESDYEREKLEQRLAKLSGGVAVIKVGAPSEAELKLRKDAFDDALAATRAAVAEGVVPGAGFALLRAADALAAAPPPADTDAACARQILLHALELPTRQLARNLGMDEGVVLERMRNSRCEGFDGITRHYVDLVASGIIDPTKVVRLALENAVSVAGTLLLADTTLVEIEEPEPHLPESGY